MQDGKREADRSSLPTMGLRMRGVKSGGGNGTARVGGEIAGFAGAVSDGWDAPVVGWVLAMEGADGVEWDGGEPLRSDVEGGGEREGDVALVVFAGPSVGAFGRLALR